MANVTYLRCTAKRCIQTLGGDNSQYWNADGFAQEQGNTGSYTDCVAEGCTDGGFDVKGIVTMLRCRASDNKKNFRFWTTVTATECVGLDPYLRAARARNVRCGCVMPRA